MDYQLTTYQLPYGTLDVKNSEKETRVCRRVSQEAAEAALEKFKEEALAVGCYICLAFVTTACKRIDLIKFDTEPRFLEDLKTNE